MTYAEFEKHLKDVVKICELESQLSDIQAEFNKSSQDELQIMFPTLVDNVVSLLRIIMGDTGDWIGYWVYELNCGEKYKPGTILDENNNEIELRTIRNLWDVLKTEESK